MKGTYNVRFYLESDMTRDAFINELDSCLDFTTVSYYELED